MSAAIPGNDRPGDDSKAREGEDATLSVDFGVVGIAVVAPAPAPVPAPADGDDAVPGDMMRDFHR